LATKNRLKQGHEQGLEQGIEKQKIDIAVKMTQEKMPIETIALITGLSPNKVLTLKNKVYK